MTWRELFDVAVVAARKPSFFETNAPLLTVINDDGDLRPHHGELQPHGAYFGGNAALLEKHLGVSGDEILYLGDHLYGDVHVSKRLLRWRTGLILRELEDELARRRDEPRRASQPVDAHARQRSTGVRALPAPPDGSPQPTRARRRRRKCRHQRAPPRNSCEINKLDARIGPLAASADKAHNANWGLLMRSGNDKSKLARQVERYADVYTSRVSNLLYVTPLRLPPQPPRLASPRPVAPGVRLELFVGRVDECVYDVEHGFRLAGHGRGNRGSPIRCGRTCR